MSYLIIGKDIVQTIADCENVLANLAKFAEKTDDKQVKQLYEQLANQQKEIVTELNSRLQYIEQEEPQLNNE